MMANSVANTKVATMMVISTQQELVPQVGNHKRWCAKLATIADGGKRNLELDMHWTYQEFSLEPAKAGHGMKKIFPSSWEGNCCDPEDMTATISGGITPPGQEIVGDADASQELSHWNRRARGFPSVAFLDPAHYCKNIPCDYCGKDWPQWMIERLLRTENTYLGFVWVNRSVRWKGLQ